MMIRSDDDDDDDDAGRRPPRKNSHHSTQEMEKYCSVLRMLFLFQLLPVCTHSKSRIPVCFRLFLVPYELLVMYYCFPLEN